MLELSAYPSTGQLRIYDIEAISLPIVYNRFGDHDPNGLLLRPQGGHRKGGHAGGLSGQGRERLHPTGAADHSRQRWDVESGMWGIFRVLSRSIRYHCESACRSLRQWWERKC